jgi:hypothetical protein
VFRFILGWGLVLHGFNLVWLLSSVIDSSGWVKPVGLALLVGAAATSAAAGLGYLGILSALHGAWRPLAFAGVALSLALVALLYLRPEAPRSPTLYLAYLPGNALVLALVLAEPLFAR